MRTTTALLTLCGVLACIAFGALPARAQRNTTSAALDRMQEAMRPALDDGALSGVAPLILVGAAPAFEETRAWFPAAALDALVEVFGPQSLRACEACMAPRLQVQNGRLEQNTGTVSLQEIVAFDATIRGTGAPARAAVWVDETPAGVAARVVSLENGQILFAGNFDDRLREQNRSGQNFNMTLDAERRLRGESLTHIFLDAALYPGQHISMDVVDQFGDRNLDLAGLTLSAFDPVIGVGAAYHRVIPEAFNLSVGAQLIASIPTVAVSALSQQGVDLIDPPITGVLVVRLPVPQTSYAVLLTASTNGRIGLGISLMNFAFLPVLP